MRIAGLGSAVSDRVTREWNSLRDRSRPARRAFKLKRMMLAARGREFLAGAPTALTAMLAERREAWRRRRAGRRRLESSSLFIGITGSSGKSSTTGLLAHILSAHGDTRQQVVWNTMRHLVGTLIEHPKDADFLVAEVAVTKPGDMRPMAELLRPDVAIVTLIELEHYSAFRKRETIAEEKGHLVELVRPGGFAVLNADDEHAMAMAGRTAERIVTFGRQQEADYRVSAMRSAFPERLSLVLDWSGGRLELKSNYLADHFWVSVAAAAATALEIGVPPQTVARQVASYEPDITRMGVIEVRDGPTFIVDTVKAPWHSLMLSFEVLARASARAGRKRVVLGQISDYAGSSRKYGAAYRAARAASDQVVFVGENAHRAKASEEDRDTGRFVGFATPREVAEHVRATAVPGEVILLKGSPNLHLERIAMSLVEEVKCWQPACGRTIGCRTCGLYGLPFEEHQGRSGPGGPTPRGLPGLWRAAMARLRRRG